MKKTLNLFIYLNIYTAFFCVLTSQNLQLSIKGKDQTPKGLIDSLDISSAYKDYQSLKVAAKRLKDELQKNGFIECELKSITKKSDSSFIANYYFGKRYREIKIYYSSFDFTKKEISTISSNFNSKYVILSINNLENSLQKLSNLKTKQGDVFARLHIENIIKNKNNSLSADLVLSKSTTRTINEIIIKGYQKFPSSFLKYYAGIRVGTLFNKEDITYKSTILENLNFVSNIKAPEILFKKDSTTVYLYLKKEKNNLFDGILGFSTNEDTEKLLFNGYLNLQLNNNLNFGETLLLNYKADGNEQQNFRTKVVVPYLFKSPFGVALELKIFKRDTTFLTNEQQARISYQINPRTNSYIGYKSYESNNLLENTNNQTDIEDYNSQYFVSGISYTKQQENNLFPVKTYIDLNLEIGNRKINNANESQYRIISTLHHIFNLNYKNSFYLKNNTRFLSSDTYLINELFRFGGINSIRGFNENSIDASFYSVLNTEYRYQFNKGIFIHSIIDAAYFENQPLDIKEKLYSFGIGIGLQTNAGMIRFNFANGNTENQNFSLSNTKIHLSISSRF